jgi:hypothetical protein
MRFPNLLYYARFFHTLQEVLLIPEAALIKAHVLSAGRVAFPITLFAISLVLRTRLHAVEMHCDKLLHD